MAAGGHMAVRQVLTPTRYWCHNAAGFAFLSVLVYGFGLMLSTGWDKAYTCTITRGVRLDPGYEFRRGYWPLSNPCNAEYDLFPGWVNVAVALVVSVTLCCLFMAALSGRRARPPARLSSCGRRHARTRRDRRPQLRTRRRGTAHRAAATLDRS